MQLRLFWVLIGLVLFTTQGHASLVQDFGAESVAGSGQSAAMSRKKNLRVAFFGKRHFRRGRFVVIRHRVKYRCLGKRRFYRANFARGVKVVHRGRKVVKIVTVVVNRCPASH